jgi:hypothetical protein
MIGKSRANSLTGNGPSFARRLRMARRVASPRASSCQESSSSRPTPQKCGTEWSSRDVTSRSS